MLLTVMLDLLGHAERIAQHVADLPVDGRYFGCVPRAYVVGGFVRDMVMGIASKDMDIEVYGVSPEVLQDLLAGMFPRLDVVGVSFGVLKVFLEDGGEIDISLPRREQKQGRGHKGFYIDADPALGVAEATRRRDFTMNAILYDPLTREYVDPFSGVRDIADGVLRVVDAATFVEDPLRVLRAVQFVGRFGLRLDGVSRELLIDMVDRGELAELSAERVTTELEKLFLLSPKPSQGFICALELGVVEKLWPELYATIDTPQNPAWHPEGDVWIHTMMVIDEAAKIIRREHMSRHDGLVLMCATLCHDYGKPLVTKLIDGVIRSPGHSEAGVAPARAWFARLSFHASIARTVAILIREHLQPAQLFWAYQKGELHDRTYGLALRRLVRRLGDVSPDMLLWCAEADMRGRGLPYNPTPHELFRELVVRYDVVRDVATPLVTGADVIALLDVEEGPIVGEILRAVEDARDTGTVSTREEAIDYILNIYPTIIPTSTAKPPIKNMRAAPRKSDV